MEYYVYAIKSVNRNYIYVGLTNNIERRVSEHNKGYNKKTKAYNLFLFYGALKTKLKMSNPCPVSLQQRRQDNSL